VTGGGKTLFAEMCMMAFRGRFPDGRFIIVVPTTALLDQWYVSLVEDLHASAKEIGCYSSRDMRPDEPKRINIVVINSARQLAAQLSSTSADSFLIVDECHRAGSVMNALALEGRYSATLGLSATPEREYDDGFEERVAPVLGQIIYEYDYRQAFHDKVISPFELVNIRVEMLEDEQSKFDLLTRRAMNELRRIENEGLPDDRLRRLLQERAAVSASATMRIPVAATLVEQNRGRRTLVFHERIPAATTLLNILLERKHRATIYNSKIDPVIRRDNLRLYRRGGFDVLVSCRALDEGTNIPETSVALIASSTASQRQRIQRLGRVLRPAPGKKIATVYTIYATDQEEKRLRKEAAALGEVASVAWYRGGIQGNG
jgi:superfamily II DNA or RNA helicase